MGHEKHLKANPKSVLTFQSISNLSVFNHPSQRNAFPPPKKSPPSALTVFSYIMIFQV